MRLTWSVKDTDIKFSEEINIIEDVKSHDMIKWFGKFGKICSANEWTLEQYTLILKGLLTDESLTDEMFKGDLTKIRERILSITYESKRSYIWREKPQRLNKRTFVTLMII